VLTIDMWLSSAFAAPDALIVAICRQPHAPLATRNPPVFAGTGSRLLEPIGSARAIKGMVTRRPRISSRRGGDSLGG
jgi:hypothetical protein